MSMNILNDISSVYLEQVVVNEKATEDSLKDRRMERGGVGGNIRYDKAPSNKSNTFGKKKPMVKISVPEKKLGYKVADIGPDGKEHNVKRGGAYMEALDPVGQEDADIDNDGDTDKSDKYLAKRRKAIGKAIAKEELELDENRRAARAAGGYKDDSKKQNDPSKAGFTGIGNMSIDQIRKMSARMDKEKKESYDPMDDPDFDHDEAEKNRGVSGKNNPKGGKALSKKKKMKEGFSDWREDLSEVIGDVKKNKSEDVKISEKEVNNKIKINPSLGEAVEELGGTFLEMVEIEDADCILDDLSESEIFLLSDKLIEEVVEEFFNECILEGYDIKEVENVLIESIDVSAALLTEAKVTMGHDTDIKTDRLAKVKSAVKKVGSGLARGAGYVAGSAVRGAKAVGREFSKGYERGRGGSSSGSSSSSPSSTPAPQTSSSSSSSTETGSKRPGLLGRIGSALKSGLKRAIGAGARAVSRGARNVARRMEDGGSKTTTSTPAPTAPKAAPKAAATAAKPKAKPAAAPKAAAKPAAAKKKGGLSSKADQILSDIRKEEFEKRYPGRGEEVMYAIDARIANKIAEQMDDEPAIATAAPAIDKKKIC